MSYAVYNFQRQTVGSDHCLNILVFFVIPSVASGQVLTQVIEGEGIGWLKLNRVRKLMEDENYRQLVVSGLNRTLERKIGPDDHINDVVRN